MAKPKSLTVSEGEISQEFDLEKLTGVSVKDPILKREIGQAIIDYMRARTESHVGLGKQPWKSQKYSDEYAGSLDFKAAGKSKTDVNLELSGDMLSSMDVKSPRGAKIKVEISDKSQLPKAFGHMTGFKGHPTIPQGKYKREFFGLTDEEFKDEILPRFESDIEDLKDKPLGKKDSQGELIKAVRKASDLFDIEEE